MSQRPYDAAISTTARMPHAADASEVGQANPGFAGFAPVEPRKAPAPPCSVATEPTMTCRSLARLQLAQAPRG